ncbi:hypothetical protein BaRGS_00008259 [Batillaria attramentaria]|uniref:Uncharacterized protein n=1 Tax=Batillaria attramentaria TaxID=370345 RepID=A0ABD0LMT7_9CAEN
MAGALAQAVHAQRVSQFWVVCLLERQAWDRSAHACVGLPVSACVYAHMGKLDGHVSRVSRSWDLIRSADAECMTKQPGMSVLPEPQFRPLTPALVSAHVFLSARDPPPGSAPDEH